MVQDCTMAAPASESLARDNPEAYIPRDRRRALTTGVAIPDRATGSAIFADISGFTPLTEALARELGPQRGAEELTATLGRVFHEVIAELDRYGGDVIYFSGDAITCWIDGDDGMRATACGLAMQAALDRVGTVTTPAGSTVQLAVKVAVAVGRARRFLVGDPSIQLIDVLAGRLIDDLADAEHHTEKGEVVLDPSAVASVGGRVDLELRDGGEGGQGGRIFGVVRGLRVHVPEAPAPEPPHALPEPVVREWLLPAVYERLRTGRGEFLAELRPAYPVFLRFGGIDYDDDDRAISKLDQFVRRAQEVMHRFGGNVLQLTLGDKGAYLYGVFGSPIAHEDDGARAAAAALELLGLEGVTSATGIQVGVTYGQLRSGTYGHAMRRTFVCLGDAVNLSARLMSAAPAGSIFVTREVRDSAGDTFIWQALPEMRVKGKSALITPFELKGSLARASRRKTRFQLPLVGRVEELSLLASRHAESLRAHGHVVGISAEAGMGKSRLLAEFVRNVRRGGRLVAFGECEAFGTKTAYFVWREVWRRLLGLDDDVSEEEQVEALVARLAAIDPALVARAPLLDDVLGLSMPDSDLTRSFDAKLRKSSLEDLLVTCLRARAREEPLVIALEDCHWIDELSLGLLEVLARRSVSLPVLFVVAYRPASETGGGLGLERLPAFSELVLDRMDPDDIAEIVRTKLGQLAGADADASPALIDLVTARSDGNPFYVEELLAFIASQDIDTSDPGTLERVQLPESLQSLVLSRIDAAPEEPRRTMKVASVVGRSFEAPLLPGAYEELGTLNTVHRHLQALRDRDLVALDREADDAWLFVHGMTQEVAYESLPFAMRSLLHGRVGGYIERSQAADLERWVPLLAHHYWRSDLEDKRREYLRKAAEQAQTSYANEAAMVYLDRLVPLIDGVERVDVMLMLAKVLQLTGNLARAESLLGDARASAIALADGSRIARCDHGLAETARRLGRFDDAAEHLRQALEQFTAVGDRAGTADVYHLGGTIANQQGDHVMARERYLRSLEIREELGDQAGVANLLTNLGIVATGSGELDEARSYLERAAAIYRGLGDRRGSSIAATNLAWASMIANEPDAGRRYSEQALALAIEIGDRFNIAIGHNNLGNALRQLGKTGPAGEEYAAAVAGYQELEDRWGFAFLLEDVALLAAASGQGEDAFRLIGAADTLRGEIRAPREESLEHEIAGGMEAVRSSMTAQAVERAGREGAALPTHEAVELALRVCQQARR